MAWVILENLLCMWFPPAFSVDEGWEGGENTRFFQGIQVDPETKNGMGNSIKFAE